MFDSSSYWSESQKQFIAVADMPMPYAKNVFAKLLRDHSDGFKDTPLYLALQARLTPTRIVAKTLLATKGECAYYWPKDERLQDDAVCRRFFYSIGRSLGVKVSTRRKGDFIHATCEPVGEEIIIRVHRDNKSKTFGR